MNLRMKNCQPIESQQFTENNPPSSMHSESGVSQWKSTLKLVDATVDVKSISNNGAKIKNPGNTLVRRVGLGRLELPALGLGNRCSIH
jgi:hypothetical protein